MSEASNALADPDRAKRIAQRNHDRRDASITQRADGSWRLSGSFGSLQGAEFAEMFAGFVDAEFRADWADARREHGDDIDIADLRRDENHRRADALLRALTAGAANPDGGLGSVPTLNVLIDEATLQTEIVGGRHEQARYREMVCRTQNGDEIDLSEAASLALWGNIRRVLLDATSNVIDLGRRRRLFTGSAREAGMLLDERCIWPGCDRPNRACEADHSIGWRAHGASVPRNCGPLCGRHNRLKDRGDYTTRRHGPNDWTITDNNANPVG